MVNGFSNFISLPILGKKGLVRHINCSISIFPVLSSIKAQSYATIYGLSSFTAPLHVRRQECHHSLRLAVLIPTEISLRLYLSKFQPAELSQLRDFAAMARGTLWQSIWSSFQPFWQKYLLLSTRVLFYGPSQFAKSQSWIASNLQNCWLKL